MHPVRALLLALLALPLPAHADPADDPALAPRYLTEALPAMVRLRGADADQGGCSGILITPRHVLSAAHCNRRGNRVVIFAPASDTGHLTVPVVATAIHPDDVPDMALETVGYDLALLTLAEDIPPEIAVPVALADPRLPDPSPRLLAGYLNGPINDLHVHFDCYINAINATVIGSDCRVVSGFSGGAILRDTARGWVLEAIIVATLSRRSAPLRALAARIDPGTFPALADALDEARDAASTVPVEDQP